MGWKGMEKSGLFKMKMCGQYRPVKMNEKNNNTLIKGI